jgi:hypothetical protein
MVSIGLLFSRPQPATDASGCPAASTAPTTVKALDIQIDSSGGAHVNGDKKFKKTDKDVMLLRVANAAARQNVIVCSIPIDTLGPGEPWDLGDCHGLLPEKAVPATPFAIDMNAIAHSLCSVKAPPKPRTFCVYVVNKASAPPGCSPAPANCGRRSRGSEIAIEVEP